MIQAPVGPHPGAGGLLQPVITLLVAACGGGLLLALLERVVPRVRRVLRRRRRRRAALGAELRARATMDELCPHGWRGQITLLGRTDQQPDAAPDGGPDHRRDKVALEWTAFEPDSSQIAVVRRVYAPTINEALDAMVADRLTDETLERIEQTALADGNEWPDPY